MPLDLPRNPSNKKGTAGAGIDAGLGQDEKEEGEEEEEEEEEEERGEGSGEPHDFVLGVLSRLKAAADAAGREGNDEDTGASRAVLACCCGCRFGE